MFFLVISPRRHRASQSLHREIHFSDRLRSGRQNIDSVACFEGSYFALVVSEPAAKPSRKSHEVTPRAWGNWCDLVDRLPCLLSNNITGAVDGLFIRK